MWYLMESNSVSLRCDDGEQQHYYVEDVWFVHQPQMRQIHSHCSWLLSIHTLWKPCGSGGSTASRFSTLLVSLPQVLLPKVQGVPFFTAAAVVFW